MSHRGNLLYNTFNSFGLCLLNDGSPTHVGRPNSANSTLDLSICSSDIFWNLSWRTLCEPHGSDHIPIIIATNSSLTAKDRFSNQNPSTDSSIPYFYDFNKANWHFFTLHIQDAVSSSLDAPTSTISYLALTNIINNAAISTILIKKINLKSHPPSPPWWNAVCSAAIKNRSSHFKAFRRSGCLTDLLKYRNVCAQTTRLLKTEKRKKWKSFCSNLNPSSSIQHLWSTARRFKNCLNPTKHPENDDWFDAFCSKVAPSYVPQDTESQPILSSFHSSHHVLTKSFNITELNLAISSRKSIASGLDNISPILLKHLPTNALVSLLNIFNEILTTQQFPTSWYSYRVIPIPKPNPNTSFCPIALSFSFCKLFEHILKSRLDWWLESNSILPPNVFAFRKEVDENKKLIMLSLNQDDVKRLFNNEFEFVTAVLNQVKLPERVEDSDSEVSDCNEKVRKPIFASDEINRAQSLDELHSRLAAIREKKYTYRGKIIKNKLQNKIKRKKKIHEKIKGEKKPNDSVEKTNKKPPQVNGTNSKTKLVFNRINFLGEQTEIAQPPNSTNAKVALDEIKTKQQMYSELAKSGEADKAKELKERDAWKNVLAKAEGVKVKDNVELLKKTIARKERQKKVSKTKWEERTNTLEKTKKEKQDKRTNNLLKKKQEKKEKIKKKAIKKGRFVPGIN
ncbi:hypothetical protein QTP88_027702 [Uroleucon formosanum]